MTARAQTAEALFDSILLGEASREDLVGRGFAFVVDGSRSQGVFSTDDLRDNNRFLVVTTIATEGGSNAIVYNPQNGKIYLVVDGCVPFDVESFSIEPK